MAFFIALLFLVFAFFYIQYSYFHICVAVVAFIYGYRQFKKRDTPFEKRERELRRKNTVDAISRGAGRSRSLLLSDSLLPRSRKSGSIAAALQKRKRAAFQPPL